MRDSLFRGTQRGQHRKMPTALEAPWITPSATLPPPPRPTCRTAPKKASSRTFRLAVLHGSHGHQWHDAHRRAHSTHGGELISAISSCRPAGGAASCNEVGSDRCYCLEILRVPSSLSACIPAILTAEDREQGELGRAHDHPSRRAGDVGRRSCAWDRHA